MAHIVRLGDKTLERGCKVVSTSAPYFKVDGLPVVLAGDRLDCNKCVIVDGDPQHTINGEAVVFDGCKTTCGDVLCASGKQFGKTA